MDRQDTPPIAKFKQIVHYICRTKAQQPEQLGAVKLHKILWYFDIKAYRMIGDSLSGTTYRKMPFGPYADLLDRTIEELQHERQLTVLKPDPGELTPTQFIGRGPVDVSALDDRQQRWLDQEIDRVCEDHSAGSISDRSHGDLWQGTALGAPMPVGAAAVRFVTPTDTTVAWAKEMLTKLNL